LLSTSKIYVPHTDHFLNATYRPTTNSLYKIQIIMCISSYMFWYRNATLWESTKTKEHKTHATIQVFIAINPVPKHVGSDTHHDL
jgi:hypothetical protein